MARGAYVPVFRANTARHRAITRFHVLRRQLADKVRGKLGLVLLIIVIATGVSLSLHAMWWLMVKLG